MRLWVRWLFCRLFGKTYLARVCGHKTKLFERVKICGQMGFYRIAGKNPDYCCSCLTNMARRCPVCGNMILVGNPIRLVQILEGFILPDCAVWRDPTLRDPEISWFVACLECADTVAERSGFWVPPGRVRRVKSLFQLASENGHAVCNNVHDIASAPWMED
ncbi:MAG: hypothetical protein ACREHG_01380 [Candidatus Saccharimonadales bacterium]